MKSHSFFKELNQRNRERSRQRNEAMQARIANPETIAMAMHLMQLERHVPLYYKKPFEAHLEDSEKLILTHDSLRGQTARKKRLVDGLTAAIENLVSKHPTLSESQLVESLNSMASRNDVVRKIDDEDVHYQDPKGRIRVIPRTALKDRLSRAKKRAKRPSC